MNDKSWVHLQDYRMLNGWYVYGGRRTWDTETFPREYKKIRAMAAVRDRYVWDLAQGKVAGAARRQRRPASCSCRRRGSATRSRIIRSRRS